MFRSLLSAALLSAFSSFSYAQNCILTVPQNPLTAAGLATPYVVSGAGCTQTLGAATFVQGVILNLDTGAIQVYNPLVILTGTTPAITPKAPTLPANHVVGLWFGTNGATTTLAATTVNGLDSLVQGNCINGGGDPFTIFGQFAACNANQWFAAADELIAAGTLVVPPLGLDFQGNMCPTTRDFGVVDQDQSDNTDTTYLSVTATGATAQNTPANVATLTQQGKAFTVIDNGSDELLITLINKAINCTSWLVQDLADTTGKTKVASLATNELQARYGARPLAYVPATDPMVVNGNGAADINKLNAYRVSVGQLPVTSLAQATVASYCTNLYAVGAPKILTWLPRLLRIPPPDFAAALSNTLGGVVVARYQAATGAGNLNCPAAIGVPIPFANFTFNGLSLVPPKKQVTPAGVVIPPNTIQSVLGIQNLVPDFNGQFGDLSRDNFGNPKPQSPIIDNGVAGACYLQVPSNPLSAAGLATPYLLSGEGCFQSLGAGSFVQGVILNTANGQISVYNPLVINIGTTPAIPPVVPKIPANAIVGLWFGTNGMTLTLVPTFNDGVDSLTEGRCVNGGGNPFSIFGQFAACNAVAWFSTAIAMVNAGTIGIPSLGTDFLGNPCPSTRNFAIVDQDESDNTDTTYLVLPNGQTAQDSPANRAALAGTGFVTIDNGSDEKLIALVDASITCTPWMVPDLLDPTGATLRVSVPTNELQAMLTASPVAYIPANDPMVVNTVTGKADLDKLNAYRLQVGQAPVTSLNAASTQSYCTNMYVVGAPAIMTWMPKTLLSPPPDFAAGLSTTLAGVLVARFNAAIGTGGLNCAALINRANPFQAFTFDPNTNALIIPKTMNPDGTIPAGTTPQILLGVDSMTPALDSQAGQMLPSMMATTTTTSNGNTFDPMIIITLVIGLAVGVIATFIIMRCYINRKVNNQKLQAGLVMANTV